MLLQLKRIFFLSVMWKTIRCLLSLKRYELSLPKITLEKIVWLHKVLINRKSPETKFSKFCEAPWIIISPQMYLVLLCRDAISLLFITNISVFIVQNFKINKLIKKQDKIQNIHYSNFQGVEKGCIGNEWVNWNRMLE